MNDMDKLEIYKELKKTLFLNRFENLLKSLKTENLSWEDITKEVETVRKERLTPMLTI
jgi:ATP-dependent helicase/DNAse subunit B